MRERDVTPAISRAKQLLEGVRGQTLGEPELLERSASLAALLLEAAEHGKRSEERERAQLLARLMHDEAGQAFTTLLTDRVYRSRDPDRVVDAARQLLRGLGIPGYLPKLARWQLRALLHVGPFVPRMAARGVLARIRDEARQVVVPAEERALHEYLERRRGEGVRINLNHLGEAVLSEDEAEARVADYSALLVLPGVESISVKISSIFSQIDLLAWDATLDRLCERLRVIYRAALAAPTGEASAGRARLVNLDMESFRDLQLTVAAFERVLDEPELLGLHAGIVLQAYLPDSAPLQEQLTDWAQKRVARGGAPIRLRVVKGANLLTERVESAARGWALPVFGSKAEVDASYKRMVEYGCRPEHASAVQLGIASHNLFDLAFGMVLRARHGVEKLVGFELLEGMANHVQRAVSAVAESALLYAPICEEDSLQTAIAYLMRRLDENTAEENFLRQSFGMTPSDAAFDQQRERFAQALALRHALDHGSRRRPDRCRAARLDSGQPFANEPDTDFTLAYNRTWLSEILARWQARACFDLPLQVGGELRDAAPQLDGFDPSRPERVPYRFAVATEDEVERALATARAATDAWARTGLEERTQLLARIAGKLREQRGELIASMVLDAGKRAEQADVEVSEAIDFAEYYARSFSDLVREHPELAWRPKGVVLVTPPWNFPLAIPAGGVFAALMAGNTVLLKPALETVLVGERLAQLCWEAGVPREVLQLVTCTDELGSRLIEDVRVDFVVLTGATSTAELFLRLRPGLPLAAETGGKNTIIVSALSDRDEAIKDVLLSAFGHAGQKCSACSLLICEAEVYDDARFMQTLRAAAASLPVGPSWDARSAVTPLIRPASGALLRALTSLEPGETWLLEPRRDPKNPRLWSPGIKLGVRDGSFTHKTELFGPLLAVMRADDIDDALRIANATPYGLTAGLHSLDEREQTHWAARIQAGNLYINRQITGAIVRRQPFGGYKASAFGAGAKAGGPNYVAQLARVTQRVSPSVTSPPQPAAAELVVRARPHLHEKERERLGIGACNYAHAFRTHFAVDHDPSGVLGERNLLRYAACDPLLLRASADCDRVDLLLGVVAALSVGARFELSLDPVHAEVAGCVGTLPRMTLALEDAATCAKRKLRGFARIRALGGLEAELSSAADAALVHIAHEPVLLTGRVELLRYCREQSLSHRYHRYGNLAPLRLLTRLREAPA
jgi:RHH-type proline utilization regulon transcriptional repressor/proline dehydrogenase/delta 1-pyrroline-5-carboxylate dehydrogenase